MIGLTEEEYRDLNYLYLQTNYTFNTYGLFSLDYFIPEYISLAQKKLILYSTVHKDFPYVIQLTPLGLETYLQHKTLRLVDSSHNP
jgi:hypothetical protein